MQKDSNTFVATWYTDPNFNEAARVTFPYEVTEARTLYAKWIANSYAVTFETNGGTAVASGSYAVIETAPESQRNGYTFESWYTDANFNESTRVTFPYTVTGATTLYAKWIANSYAVTF